MKIPRSHLVLISLLILATIFTFRNLPQSFFEQDEWHSFGHYIHLLSLSPSDALKNAFPAGALGHFTPFSLLLKMGLFLIFGLDAKGYFLMSILFHFLTVIVVYYLAFLLTRRVFPAFLAALFFALNSSHQQSITWLGTFEGTEGATLFGVLSLAFLIVSLRGGRRVFLILSFLAILVALLFKETALTFLPVLIGLLYFDKNAKMKLRKIASLIGLLSLYLVVRQLYALISIKSAGPIINGGNGLEPLILRTLTIPIKIFSEVIFPQSSLINWSLHLEKPLTHLMAKLNIPLPNSNYFFYDLITITAGVLLILLISLFSRKAKDRKPFYVGLALTWVTALPLIPLKSNLSVLDSRFLYPATVGLSIVVSAVLSCLLEGRNLKKGITIGYLFMAILATLILLHFLALNETINQAVNRGIERVNILTSIKKLYPDLPHKAIFFTESDKSYYGLPPQERVLPFQSGLGQTLLVWYQKTTNFPLQLFTNEFLWNIEDEGYEEIGNHGFGYFRDFQQLGRTVEKYRLSPRSIIAFSYDSEDKKLSDITSLIRGSVEGYLSPKREILRSELMVTASENSGEAYLAVDNDIQSFWDSKVTYDNPQSFEIGLRSPRKITELLIDSDGNKDQNEVGYRVSLSNDHKDWRVVFYAKRYPPHGRGLVDIYFKPEFARFVRIEQIGSHHYASWVIYEIKVYEAETH